MFLFSLVYSRLVAGIVVELSPRIMFLFSVYTVIDYNIRLYQTFLKKNSGNIDASSGADSRIYFSKSSELSASLHVLKFPNSLRYLISILIQRIIYFTIYDIF